MGTTMKGTGSTTSAKNHNALTALLFAAVLVVALNTWLAFRSIDILVDSEAWVQHTLQVISQVEQIMGSAKDAETGTRGYLITGEALYLEPYNRAVQQLPAELDAFGKLTADNRSQQERLTNLRAVLDRRLAFLAQGIGGKKDGASVEQIHTLAMGGAGNVEMDRLRGIADDMEAEERRLLVLRTGDAHRNSQRARWTIALASALDLVLLVLIFRYLSRERLLRLEKERVAVLLAASKAETEAKAAEIQLLNQELEERVRLRTVELETTNRELEAFSYSVSHDLRAPLRTIDGFSLALEEDYAGAVDAVGKDYIRRVRTGVQRMGQLIDALLQLSRITRAELVREQFDMHDVAQSVVQEIEQGILFATGNDGIDTEAKPIQFRVGTGPTALGDPKLVRVALENMLGNAVKFSSKVAAPVIEFGWDSAAGAWFVRDNGAGFDMSYASKLFNAFNRLHGDKDFKGSGIGLATVARVVRRHHGKIWADSTVGRGATFWFTLGSHPWPNLLA